jgi:NUMOD4 motif/HNH endonuclease
MAEWAPIPGYDRYEVSQLGAVRNILTGTILKPVVHNSGYLCVCLHYAVQKHRLELIHRLVLRAFVGEPPAGTECRHLDGIRHNIALSNLEWGTPQENADDRKRHGTARYVGPTAPARGERNAAAKLSVAAVLYIRKMLEFGFTMQSAAEDFGVSKSTVFDIKHRNIWAHV